MTNNRLMGYGCAWVTDRSYYNIQHIPYTISNNFYNTHIFLKMVATMEVQVITYPMRSKHSKKGSSLSAS